MTFSQNSPLHCCFGAGENLRKYLKFSIHSRKYLHSGFDFGLEKEMSHGTLYHNIQNVIFLLPKSSWNSKLFKLHLEYIEF